MSEQEPVVRQRTDALDSLGNTTAATGKGFAIGSAALTALALLAAYVEEVRVGIDLWVEGAPAVAESVDMSNANVLIVSPNVLAYRGPGDEANQAFLVFPSSKNNRSPKLQEIIEAKSGQTVESVNLDELKRNDKVKANKEATIPDFVRYYRVNLMNPFVLVGMFMGVMLVFVFCGLTMKAVGSAAVRWSKKSAGSSEKSPGLWMAPANRIMPRVSQSVPPQPNAR